MRTSARVSASASASASTDARVGEREGGQASEMVCSPEKSQAANNARRQVADPVLARAHSTTSASRPRSSGSRRTWRARRRPSSERATEAEPPAHRGSIACGSGGSRSCCCGCACCWPTPKNDATPRRQRQRRRRRRSTYRLLCRVDHGCEQFQGALPVARRRQATAAAPIRLSIVQQEGFLCSAAVPRGRFRANT